MSDILESSAVITVKKIFNHFANSMVFEVVPSFEVMLLLVYQSDLNKVC